MKNDLLIIGEITSALPLLDLLLASSPSKKTQPEDMTVPPFFVKRKRPQLPDQENLQTLASVTSEGDFFLTQSEIRFYRESNSRTKEYY